MTDSFVTQCPHCQTSFRVTHHQLSVARGVVRCGHCLQVFNAAKQLLEQNRAKAGGVPMVPPEPPAEAPAAPAPAASERAPVKPEDWAATVQALDELDLDEELARLERRGQPAEPRVAPADDALQARRDEPQADDLGSTPFGTATDDVLEPQATDEPAPVLMEQELLTLEPGPGDRTEPTLGNSLDLDDEPAAHRPVEIDDVRDIDEPLPSDDALIHEKGLSARDDDALDIHLSARDDDPTEPLPGERQEPGFAAKAERPSRKEPLVDVVDDPLQLGWEPPRPNWGKRLLWGVLTLLAAGLLAFQYVWFHFDELARQDQYRPLFQQLCPTLGCEVPTRVDIGRIKSSNLVVRSHPDFKGALIVDAIIYNRAPFAQPFPLLELRFADLNGQLIASRRFKPSEYLSGELAGRGEMPSQTPIHIALDILDPGPKAVNYSLSFRSPE
ncbi:DUF3426 domain-containing protein [Pseudomonas plecoglossicida]|uniref:DUF3426 domain-containing protein n=3 Tax=Pseudomonas plecoglossicida TaxID=70775 RepID=A0AAD0QY47_PSEDL|nr:DUF3426 domain-containing protein [Pseudomonas plecoglossicida]AXM96771.1 DUF3426 domain-containing protein [Pseudomonas plecoglossicida]EPB93496.1 Zinc finger-domain-containing protein [Pseudomonas plecoglossicida NB2011]QLB53854.1 DUF3426 domain-containing protein [Pseudomonas plecoglossicida]GLR36771.1 hypothetical protein GCM10011247_21680 [Pseudomonas plecoglossicida]